MDSWQSFPFENPAYQFFNLLPLHLFSTHKNWPTIVEYNNFLLAIGKKIISGGGQSISFVEQLHKSDLFEEQYEPRIFLKGEVLTRPNRWHDFFNMLIWLSFPRIKSSINSLQYHAMSARNNSGKQRTALENALTLFDENGIIIVSSDEQLLQLIKDFRWKDLFWIHRQKVTENLRCYIFGHSLHEKFLQPYIGMTGHAILLHEEKDFFDRDLKFQLEKLDNYLADALQNYSTKNLHPFPVLGMPNWHSDNVAENFYENKNYFREARHVQGAG